MEPAVLAGTSIEALCLIVDVALGLARTQVEIRAMMDRHRTNARPSPLGGAGLLVALYLSVQDQWGRWRQGKWRLGPAARFVDIVEIRSREFAG